MLLACGRENHVQQADWKQNYCWAFKNVFTLSVHRWNSLEHHIFVDQRATLKRPGDCPFFRILPTLNSTIARWRYLTTTTKIHFGFALLFKLVNPAVDLRTIALICTRKNKLTDSGSCSKMASSCNCPINVTTACHRHKWAQPRSQGSLLLDSRNARNWSELFKMGLGWGNPGLVRNLSSNINT